MANMHLVTGYAGREHVTAADVAAFNIGLLGSSQFVYGKGNRLEASVVTNNLVRVLDGDIYMQGRHVRLNEGSYVDLIIENGEQGNFRNDLIVARYTLDSVTGVEECNLVVIKGTPVGASPVDPAYTSGDLVTEHDTLNDMPLYRVSLDGINITGLTPLFETFGGLEAEINAITPDKIGAVKKSGDTMTGNLIVANDGWPGLFVRGTTREGILENAQSQCVVIQNRSVNDVNSRSVLELYDETHDVSDIIRFYTLKNGETKHYPIIHTGNTEAHKISRIQIGTYQGTGTNGAGNPPSLTFSFVPKMVFIMGDTLNENKQYLATFIKGAVDARGVSRGMIKTANSGANHPVVTWSNTTVSWYLDSNSSAFLEMNTSGRTYAYVALG